LQSGERRAREQRKYQIQKYEKTLDRKVKCLRHKMMPQIPVSRGVQPMATLFKELSKKTTCCFPFQDIFKGQYLVKKSISKVELLVKRKKAGK
jgi:hypothetical protein